MLNGYESCYWKNATGLPIFSSGSTLAVLNRNSVDSGSSGSGSKAWIASAVVGPIVGLAIVAELFWFFLGKRKSRRRDMHAETEPGAPNGMHQNSSGGYVPVNGQYLMTLQAPRIGTKTRSPPAYENKQTNRLVEADSEQVHEMENNDVRYELPP